MIRLLVLFILAHLIWPVCIAVHGTDRPTPPQQQIILDDGAPIKVWQPDRLPWGRR